MVFMPAGVLADHYPFAHGRDAIRAAMQNVCEAGLGRSIYLSIVYLSIVRARAGKDTSDWLAVPWANAAPMPIRSTAVMDKEER